MDNETRDYINRSLDGIYEDLYKRVKPYGVGKVRNIQKRSIEEKVSLIQEIMEATWKIEVDETAGKYEKNLLQEKLKKTEDELEKCRMAKGYCTSKKSKKGNKCAYKKEVDSRLVVDLYKQGLNISQIAKKLKTSRPTVYNRLEKMGLHVRIKKEGSQSSQFIDDDFPFK